MKIYGKCKNCNTEISFWSFADTRIDFVMEKGEFKELNCDTCGTNNRIHIDNLHAKKSRIAQI